MRAHANPPRLRLRSSHSWTKADPRRVVDPPRTPSPETRASRTLRHLARVAFPDAGRARRDHALSTSRHGSTHVRAKPGRRGRRPPPDGAAFSGEGGEAPAALVVSVVEFTMYEARGTRRTRSISRRSTRDDPPERDDGGANRESVRRIDNRSDAHSIKITREEGSLLVYASDAFGPTARRVPPRRSFSRTPAALRRPALPSLAPPRLGPLSPRGARRGAHRLRAPPAPEHARAPRPRTRRRPSSPGGPHAPPCAAGSARRSPPSSRGRHFAERRQPAPAARPSGASSAASSSAPKSRLLPLAGLVRAEPRVARLVVAVETRRDGSDIPLLSLERTRRTIRRRPTRLTRRRPIRRAPASPSPSELPLAPGPLAPSSSSRRRRTRARFPRAPRSESSRSQSSAAGSPPPASAASRCFACARASTVSPPQSSLRLRDGDFDRRMCGGGRRPRPRALSMLTACARSGRPGQTRPRRGAPVAAAVHDVSALSGPGSARRGH